MVFLAVSKLTAMRFGGLGGDERNQEMRFIMLELQRVCGVLEQEHTQLAGDGAS